MNRVKSVSDALAHTSECVDQAHGLFQFAIVRNGKRYFHEAETLGLLESKMCVHLDEDGAHTEKQSIGYRFTSRGRLALRSLRENGLFEP